MEQEAAPVEYLNEVFKHFHELGLFTKTQTMESLQKRKFWLR